MAGSSKIGRNAPCPCGSADTVVILGMAVGPVQANKVRIGNSAQVVGNIFHNELTIEPGAYHEGRRPWRPNIERKPIFER